MKKKALWAAVLILTALSAIAFTAYADPGVFLLTPRGRIRVALRSIGSGTATWQAVAPRVYDGSFSAQLYTTGASDGGEILIGPLGWPLSYFQDAKITFWTYHRGVLPIDPTAQPYINIVLDNGRVMEGLTSTTVKGGAILSEARGYPGADIWIQMMPSGGWYTSFGTDDSVLSPVSTCLLASTCKMADWQKAFPTAKVIQIEIVYGNWILTTGGQYINIDNVSLLGAIVPIEPEVIAAS
jgi:hypothetical protein